MKIAELFAELGFKVEGADELKAFDTTLKSIAQSARNAALALKILSRTTLPKTASVVKLVTAKPGAVMTTTPTGAAGGAPPLAAPPVPGNVAVNQGLKSLATFAKQLVGFGSLAYLLKSLISNLYSMVRTSASASFGLDKFTRQTGVTLAEMKTWEQVAAANDLTAEEVAENLKSLQQNAVKISMGLGGTNANRWGIDPLLALTNPGGVFRRFQEVTRSMTQAQAMAVAENAGIDARVAQMLLREREHPTATRAGLALSPEQLETTRSLGVAFNNLRVIMSSLADKITTDIAPGLTHILDFVTRMGAIFAGSDSARRLALLGPPGTSGLIMGAEIRKDLVGKGVLSMVHALLPRSSSVTNNIDVSVDGAARPNETARATAEAVQRSISDAYYQRASPWGPQIPNPQ